MLESSKPKKTSMTTGLFVQSAELASKSNSWLFLRIHKMLKLVRYAVYAGR
jgi:hypothetical protein